MSRYERFEDLPVWQEAARLYNAVLDLMERGGIPLSWSYRNQLERAALSVSNNIAEGFERTTTGELLNFIGIARGSAGEVRSMIAVVSTRPALRGRVPELERLAAMAASCARQLTAWAGSIEQSGIVGKRHLTPEAREKKDLRRRAAQYRRDFLRSLKPGHPMYSTPEAEAARRGESEGGGNGEGYSQ